MLKLTLAPAPLLMLMAWLMAGPAARQSAAIDEVPHIGAGLSYVQKLDLRLNGEHPPLAKALAAMPLVWVGTTADYQSVSWTMSREFFPAYLAQWVFGEWVLGPWNDRQRTLFLARLPMLLLTLALGVLIYGCAYRIGGLAGGLLCLSAYVSMPVFLAFGPMVLTDVPVTLFSLLALIAAASVWKRPTRASAYWFGVALAAALLTKFSAGLVLIAIGIFVRYSSRVAIAGHEISLSQVHERKRTLWLGLGLAAVLVYATYSVLSWNQPMDVQHRIGEGPFATAIGRLLMPPWLYLRGLTMVLFTSVRPAYLLGESFPHGMPLYFPLLFLWKSPPGFLALLGVGAALALRLRSAAPIGTTQAVLWRILWISCAVFTSACILSRLNIGFRHFTTPLALLILLLAPLPRLLGKSGRAAVALFAVGSIVSAVTAYPHFLPYVNALSLAQPAYQLFGDSNLDWNHALPEAARFVEARGIEDALVDPYGLSDPSLEIPGARLWDCQQVSEDHGGRWAIVSANAIIEAHNCAWLIPHIREKLAGGSMYAIQLPARIPPTGSPEGPPPSSQRRSIFGLPVDLRLLVTELSREPQKLPERYAELESQLAPQHATVGLYPPKTPVQWPWQRRR